MQVFKGTELVLKKIIIEPRALKFGTEMKKKKKFLFLVFFLGCIVFDFFNSKFWYSLKKLHRSQF